MALEQQQGSARVTGSVALTAAIASVRHPTRDRTAPEAAEAAEGAIPAGPVPYG
ncbi:hypothetical protein ACIRU3_34880 [Streptomyces sp. NPDC101151]|uniref:hypothetical protein n=1 Tax=Streptomyces sp. NPDC101151 TaxID=3366115 RepID=UPI0037FB4719